MTNKILKDVTLDYAPPSERCYCPCHITLGSAVHCAGERCTCGHARVTSKVAAAYGPAARLNEVQDLAHAAIVQATAERDAARAQRNDARAEVHRAMAALKPEGARADEATTKARLDAALKRMGEGEIWLIPIEPAQPRTGDASGDWTPPKKPWPYGPLVK